MNWKSPADCKYCKEYTVKRAGLTNKNDKADISRLNAKKRLHDGLYHQDVERLEREYNAQINDEKKSTKVSKSESDRAADPFAQM